MEQYSKLTEEQKSSVREGPSAQTTSTTEETKYVIAEAASLEEASTEPEEDISQEINARVSERVQVLTEENQLKINQ